MEKFLDLEARRDDDSDEEDWLEDELPDFVVAEDEECGVPRPSQLLPRQCNGDMEDWIDSLLQRYSRALAPAPSTAQPQTTHMQGDLDARAIPYQMLPLYCIATKVGCEATICRALRDQLPPGHLNDILFALPHKPGFIFWSLSTDEPFGTPDEPSNSPDDHFDINKYLEQVDASIPLCSPPSVSEISISELPEIMDYFIPNSTFPMWRIRCRFGWESRVVASMRQKLPNGRDADRIFVLVSSPMCVYWSVAPNPFIDIRAFVREIPGVYIERGNVGASTMPPEQWASLIKNLLSIRPHLYAGRWVRVLKGRYRNEIGIISSATPTCAFMLVLPHLDASDAPSKGGKRRRGSRPANAPLFDPSEVQPTRLRVLSRDRALYKVGEACYDHGLALVMVPSIDLDVNVPGIDYQSLYLFSQSMHPLFSPRRVPYIQDWMFRPGQHVRRVDDPTSDGLVESFNDGGVVVSFSGYCTQLGWLEVVKVFFAGDHVRVFAGPCLGRNGWVEHAAGSSVHILNKSRDVIERLTVHANSCELFPPWEPISNPRGMVAKPFVNVDPRSVGQHVRIVEERHPYCNYSGTITEIVMDRYPEKTSLRIRLFSTKYQNGVSAIVDAKNVVPLQKDDTERHMRSGPTPWIGLPATIIQSGHPFRAYPAIVRDVLIHQQTPSGLKLQLEITTYQGAVSRRLVIVDYDHVIDPETQWELRVKTPLTVEQFSFFPPDAYVRKRLEIRVPKAIPVQLRQESSRPSTPPPPPERHSSPTWDPAADKAEPYTPSSIWKRILLEDIALRVRNIKTGKQIVVQKRLNALKTAFCWFYTWRGKEREIDETSFEPMTPKARWEGLLMIISPGNIGKLVRPVRQRYADGVTNWTLRVVKQVPDHPDIITDEELVVESSCLCEVEESPASKRLNDVQARQLKEPAAGHNFP